MSENMKWEPLSGYKQNTVIEFLTHKSIKPIEIFCCLKVVYGDVKMDISKVRAWVCKAHTGPLSLFDEPHSECPKMRRSAKVEQQIDEKIHQNRTITRWQLVEETGETLETTNKMIKKLNYRRTYSKYIFLLQFEELFNFTHFHSKFYKFRIKSFAGSDCPRTRKP